MKLNELVRTALDLEQLLIDMGGEITPEFEFKLQEANINITNKMQAYAHVIESLKQRKEYALNRIKEWHAIAEQCERGVDNLTQLLDINLTMLGRPIEHGAEYTIARQNNPPSVVISDEAKIPGEFITTEMKTKINKRDILNALKDNIEVPGAHLTTGTRIVIKISRKKIGDYGPMENL